MPYPIDFPQATRPIARPASMEENQCGPVRAFVGQIEQGPNEGETQFICCWQLSPDDLQGLIHNGGKIFLSFVGGIVPHCPGTSFEEMRAPM